MRSFRSLTVGTIAVPLCGGMVVVTSVATVTLSCGGVTSGQDGSPGADAGGHVRDASVRDGGFGGSRDASTDRIVDARIDGRDAMPPLVCPATPPLDGSPCGGPSGFSFGACTWGTHPDPVCRVLADCAGPPGARTWTVTQPGKSALGASCDRPLLPAECPSTAPADGALCSGSPACFYPDGTGCMCTALALGTGGPPCCSVFSGCNTSWCVAAPAARWVCQGPSTVAGCEPFPNAGTPCALPDGTYCGDDPVASSRCGSAGSRAVCRGGIWAWDGYRCGNCASPDTPISTPLGERRIADLGEGDLVYSVDHDAIVPVPIVRVNRTRVSAHSVVRVDLADGRVLEISAGHPTADGRTFGDLAPGSALDGHGIVSARRVPYAHPFTYDILPGSDTGTYFAAGVRIGSTLGPPPARRAASVSTP